MYQRKLPCTVVDIANPPYHVLGIEILLRQRLIRTSVFQPRFPPHGVNDGAIDGLGNNVFAYSYAKTEGRCLRVPYTSNFSFCGISSRAGNHATSERENGNDLSPSREIRGNNTKELRLGISPRDRLLEANCKLGAEEAVGAAARDFRME